MLLKKRKKSFRPSRTVGILSHWECGDRVPGSPSWGLLASDGILKTDFGKWSSTCLCAAIVSSYFPLMCSRAVKVSRSISSKTSGGYTAMMREQRKFLLALLGSSQDAQTSAAAAGLWKSKGRDAHHHQPESLSGMALRSPLSYKCRLSGILASIF